MNSDRIERYADSSGRWRWRHVAGNGQIDNASEQARQAGQVLRQMLRQMLRQLCVPRRKASR